MKVHRPLAQTALRLLSIMATMWIQMSDGLEEVTFPDSKVHGAYMGPTWGQQDLGGPHVGPMNLVIRVVRIIPRFFKDDAL